MGKRNSRKTGQKKLKDNFEVVHSICESNIELIKENLSKLEDEKKLLDLEGLRNQITHYISRIYSEFALDLDERRASRLHSKDFFEEKTLPNLKITPEFMGKMNELLVNIKDDESIQKIKDFVYKHADSFVDQLKEAFLDMINARRQLQIILMHEAYAYIDNVSKEITKLLGCILKNDEKKIRNHHKRVFYHKIMKNRGDLVEYIAFNSSPSFSETQIFKKFKKFEKRERSEMREQKEFADKSLGQKQLKRSGILIIESSENENFEDSSFLSMRASTGSNMSQEKDSSESVYFCSIDQVVEYIEGNLKQTKRKKKRAKSIRNSKASVLDQEVQEFEKKLDLSPAECRLKVILPDCFLQGLREQIKTCQEKWKSSKSRLSH